MEPPPVSSPNGTKLESCYPTRVEGAGAGGDEPRAMGATGDRPGVGTRHAARQAPGTAAGAARGAAGSGNSDTDVTADKQRWSTLGTTQLVPAAAAENRAITGPASADTWIGTAAEEAEQQKRRASGARVTDAPCVGVDRHQELCIRIQ